MGSASCTIHTNTRGYILQKNTQLGQPQEDNWGYTHTLGVPCKEHWLLINFGWWELRNITSFNLHRNIKALDGFASNFAILDFSKQGLIKKGALGCTCAPPGGAPLRPPRPRTTTSIGRELLQETVNTSERGCRSEATDHRRVIMDISGGTHDWACHI